MSLEIAKDGKKRCFGNNSTIYAEYHDNEWGVPLHDEVALFEMLILEGAQAGLSWEIVLKKRDSYRKSFYNFNPNKVAIMSDDELEKLYKEGDIIRNHLKIYSVRKNAKIFLEIKKEFITFNKYIWSFVNHNTIINHWTEISDMPVTTKESDKLSKDLKKRGMSFVGPKIIYAFMQAVGMVDDHLEECWCRNQ